MRTLVIDNYDSFTHNLVHLLAVVNQDQPVVIRNDEVDWDEIRHWSFDNVVISPGPGRPDKQTDFGVSRDLIARCSKPLLGVCLGHQGIGDFFGATVTRAPTPVHGKATSVHHDGHPLFTSIPSPFDAARYHSLIVKAPIPDDLRRIAWTQDDLVMALAHRQRPLWGVQFHPESIITEHGFELVRNFRDLSRQTARQCVAVPRADQRLDGSRSLVAVWRELPGSLDTEAAFCELFANSATAFWLDSSLVEEGRSRWSYMGDASDESATVVQYDVNSSVLGIVQTDAHSELPISIFDFLARFEGISLDNPPPCPFVGGHVGWLGYELGRECGGTTPGVSSVPDALFIQANRFIAVDHLTARSYVVAIGPENEPASGRWVDDTVRRLSRVSSPSPLRRNSREEPLVFHLRRSRSTYLGDVAQCLEWIRQGETYQVCLTNEISTQAKVDPLELYRVLRKTNPAPYAAFIRWPGGEVLSASPERFLSVSEAKHVEAKPIKGTIARDADPTVDRQLALELARSSKDRAENIMIVDLLRNDLSRVCRPGSVVVPKLCDIESYATVHQMVSTVHGELRDGHSAIDLLRAAFPGGSMTGAPKVRTLELIHQLEGRARGVYSGALGWLGYNGAVDLSIVIRTIVAAAGRLSMGVGGGIVAQSTPEGEFDEMLLKAKASIRAIVLAANGSFDDGSYQIEGI